MAGIVSIVYYLDGYIAGTPDVSHLVSSMPQDARRKQLTSRKQG